MGIGDWGLGTGDWGLGIGDWGLTKRQGSRDLLAGEKEQKRGFDPNCCASFPQGTRTT
ncbi:MAG: hypothetical protein ACFKPT_32100 [Gloeotrichia echinulata GP01]